MAGRRGFTLVELAVVLGLMGIAAALAVPWMHAWIVHLRTRSAANQLAGDLAQVRALAVRGGWGAQLVIEPSPECPSPASGAAGYRYRIEALADGADPAARVDLRARRGRICLSSNRSAEVVFDSRGLIAGHNNRTLVVREGTHPADTITLSSVGRVYRRF